VTFSYNTGPCRVCGKVMTGAGYAVKAHRDMHVRNGDLITVTQYTWKGVAKATRTIQPEERRWWRERGWFIDFEECQQWYKLQEDSKRKGAPENAAKVRAALEAK
jgi:hypothetical protein